jgi:superoxide dismutase
MMEKLIKYALDNDAVGFISRMKEKMSSSYKETRTTMSQKVAADMAGVDVVQEEIMNVFVHASGKGIKWRTSDQRTGGEASFSDLKDEKKLRAYLTKCFGSKKTFTIEVREAEDTKWDLYVDGKKANKSPMSKDEMESMEDKFRKNGKKDIESKIVN